ncbi:MAG: polysaccharide deacetylase family protein [Pseudomonadota bacterium]
MSHDLSDVDMPLANKTGPKIILTFDIEDWFHILDNDETGSADQWENFECRVERNCDTILALLSERSQDATFFILGWVARKFPQLVRRISDQGYEVGTHSDMHQLVYSQSWDEFTEDLRVSVSCLQDVTGKQVRAYRAPGFSVIGELQRFHDELIANGIEVDCSLFPARRAHGGISSFPYRNPCLLTGEAGLIKEFPMSTFPIWNQQIVFSGGGYFRLIPYQAIRLLTTRSDYIMSYFHPRDFDPSQPIVPGLSLMRRFKSYVGLGHALHKLGRWMDDFPMTSVAAAEAEIDWESADRYRV